MVYIMEFVKAYGVKLNGYRWGKQRERSREEAKESKSKVIKVVGRDSWLNCRR